jgi:hypothetical protein
LEEVSRVSNAQSDMYARVPHRVLESGGFEATPPHDHLDLFSREELRKALLMLLSPSDAQALERTMYSAESRESGVFLYDDVVNALSLVSDRAARQVQLLRRETDADAHRRMEAFRAKLEQHTKPPARRVDLLPED